MRGTIKQKISDAVPELAGKVYDADAAFTLPLPLCIVRQGEETSEFPWNGYRRYFDVIPYGSSGFDEVDRLSEQIILALHEEVLSVGSGHSFTCMYTGNVGGDTVDADRKGVTRTLRFTAMHPPGVTASESQDDPWLHDLQVWTQEIVGPEWAVYTGWWPSGYTRPCILWRMTNSDLKLTNQMALEVDNRFSIHIIGRSAEEEQNMVRMLLEMIGRQTRLPLEVIGKRQAVVKECTASPQADRITTGQISVLLSMKTGRTVQEEPLMRHIHYKENPDKLR